MPQLGLHPDQGAAEKRTGLHLLQIGGALRAHPRGRGVPRPGKDRGALARRGRNHVQGRGLPAEEKQHRPHTGLRAPDGGRQARGRRHALRSRPYHPRHGGAPARNGVHAHRRPARDFVAPGADAHPAARNDGRRRLGRHRQRVRMVLRRAGREGHRGGVHAPHDAARGRGGVEGDGARIPQTAGGGDDLDDREIGQGQRRRALRGRDRGQKGPRNPDGGHRALGRGDQVQHRGDRPRRAGHRRGARQSARRPVLPHQCSGRIRHRRHRGRPGAGARGLGRGYLLRRGHLRAGSRTGGLFGHPVVRIHLARGGFGRHDRAAGAGAGCRL